MTDANARIIRAPRGPEITCKNWYAEAAMRMLMNNLDPDVAERPQDLVVYGGIGKAARNWNAFDKIVATLKTLEADETLLVQSGKPVAVFKTHSGAPRVLIANSNLVPKWANWEHFNALDRKGLMMYGQMTAGSWIYIGSQGIVQGTYETFVEMGRQHFAGDLSGKWILTAGLGGMGGAQPLAATMRSKLSQSRAARPMPPYTTSSWGFSATSGSRLFMSIRSGASVSQLLADSLGPLGARITRALSRRVGIEILLRHGVRSCARSVEAR